MPETPGPSDIFPHNTQEPFAAIAELAKSAKGIRELVSVAEPILRNRFSVVRKESLLDAFIAVFLEKAPKDEELRNIPSNLPRDKRPDIIKDIIVLSLALYGLQEAIRLGAISPKQNIQRSLQAVKGIRFTNVSGEEVEVPNVSPMDPPLFIPMHHEIKNDNPYFLETISDFVAHWYQGYDHLYDLQQDCVQTAVTVYYLMKYWPFDGSDPYFPAGPDIFPTPGQTGGGPQPKSRPRLRIIRGDTSDAL